MIDVEPLIRAELDRLVPAPSGARADWSDVVGRAALSRPTWSSRSRLALAVGFALAVLVSAAAVARTLGGFEDWLSGTPGKPAAKEAQERFTGANGRSWASFPTTTELRELVRAEAGGKEYVLYGFRSGNSLCLKLAAEGVARQPHACAPKSMLANISEPIVVVMGQYLISDRASRPTAELSFGIAADSVARVDVHADDGSHRAWVSGNAYLYLRPAPNSPNRIRRVSAVTTSGRRASVPVTSFRRGVSGVETAPGPTELEARIANPQIGWYERGERRGVSADQVRLTAEERGWFRGARLVKPDPLSDFVIGLSGHYCWVTRHGKGCGGSLFQRGPLHVGASGGFTSEFITVHGAAADGVARVTIHLADGQRMRAPMQHNLFAAVVPTSRFPIRLVGYDTRDRVVAIETHVNFIRGEVVPAKAKRLHQVLETTAPNGATALLELGQRVRHVQCWRARFGSITRGDCLSLPRGGPAIEVHLVQPVGRDLFVVGRVGDAVARVDLELPLHNRIATVRTVDGYYVLAVPSEHLGRRRRHAYVVGFDRAGHRAQRHGFFYRVR